MSRWVAAVAIFLPITAIIALVVVSEVSTNDLPGDARRVLSERPPCQQIQVQRQGESRLFQNILVINGQTKTENDKFDCFAALWTHMKTKPAGIMNYVWSEEYRDQQIQRAFSRPKAPPCHGVLIYPHPNSDEPPKCEPFGVGRRAP